MIPVTHLIDCLLEKATQPLEAELGWDSWSVCCGLAQQAEAAALIQNSSLMTQNATSLAIRGSTSLGNICSCNSFLVSIWARKLRWCGVVAVQGTEWHLPNTWPQTSTGTTWQQLLQDAVTRGHAADRAQQKTCWPASAWITCQPLIRNSSSAKPFNLTLTILSVYALCVWLTFLPTCVLAVAVCACEQLVYNRV